MKAILEYDMLEEREELKDALNSWRYTLALSNIKDQVRAMWKHEELSEEVYERVDLIYTIICDEIGEADVCL